MVRRPFRGIRSLAFVTLFVSVACASTLDRARDAKGEGELSEALALYRKAAASGDVTAKAELAVYLTDHAKQVQRDDPALAELELREAVELQPSAERPRIALARLYLDGDREDEALAVLESAADCTECSRFLGLVAFEKGRKLLAAKKPGDAISAFQRSLELLADPVTALALAEAHLGVEDHPAALEGLRAAMTLIQPEDHNAQKAFVTLRRRLVVHAARAEAYDLADEAAELQVQGTSIEAWLELQNELVTLLQAKGEADRAINHLLQLKASADGRLAEQAGRSLVRLYSVRAALELRRGEVDKANASLDQALELDPEDWVARLQRLLASDVTKEPAAIDKTIKWLLEEVPSEVLGRKSVASILHARRAELHLAKGEVAAARASIAEAQALDNGVPELHLALARVLARERVEGLTRKAAKEIRDRGLVRYPDQAIRRYAEALGELDWGLKLAEELGPHYPWRGPGTEKAITALQGEIRAFYGPLVQFQAKATTVVILRAPESESVQLRLSGAGGYNRNLSIEAGQERTLTVREPGLLVVEGHGDGFALITEPYTTVTISL